jgi:hypothetical protein
MKRLLSSRKLWGALVGSLCIALIVMLTPKEQITTVTTVVGGLWTLAISGQAIKDGIETYKKQ